MAANSPWRSLAPELQAPAFQAPEFQVPEFHDWIVLHVEPATAMRTAQLPRNARSRARRYIQ
jgi:hypothetical protein